MKKLYLALFAVPMLANAAPQYSQQYHRCMDQNQTTMGMLECQSNEIQSQESRLNKSYNELMKNLTGNHAKVFRESQRAWVKYKDLSAKAAGLEYEGGSIAGLASSARYLELTVEKADEIEAMLQEIQSR